jgi:membrane associated rhomboid family serine protease
MPPETWIQIAWTANAEALASWRLTLEALGIPFVLQPLEPNGGWAFFVAEEDAGRAREALRAALDEEWGDEARQEREQQRLRDEAARAEAQRGRLSWIPGALFAVALVEFAVLAGLGDAGWHTRWFEAGANVLALTRTEPWRAVTSLTLHADQAHLLLNAIAAMFLLPLACEFWGTGVGIFLTVLAGAAGNWVEAHVGGNLLSVGASTALFGALGVAGGTRVLRRGTSWGEAFRVGVVVLVMFAMFGLGGETRDPLDILFPNPATPHVQSHVDILAHVLGLGFGVAFGAAARGLLRERPRPWLQWLAGGATLAMVVGAWALAL